MSREYSDSEITMESRNGQNVNRDRLGLSFSIDYLLFNRVRGSKEEEMDNSVVQGKENHRDPKLKVELDSEEPSATGSEKPKTSEEEWDEEECKSSENSDSTQERSLNKSADKPNQSYIALISKAILASDEKKLLLCDIYQWIMDHYPYFKSRDKNWRNSVRHNLSLNDCFIKAGRSDNGKGHYWAIHPTNFQDFSKGDYQCRRARRRVRKMPGQMHLSSLSSPFYPRSSLAYPHRTTCWCCPQVPAIPLSSLAPRFYWPWSSMQPQMGIYLGLNAPYPETD